MEKKTKNTRANIIEVATRLFMDNGYQSTSTRQIAQLAEITQPNLYHHFQNKEEVYVGVIENLLSEVNAELDAIVTNTSLTTTMKLRNVAECLQANHPFDFELMMHDFKTKLTQETQKNLFLLWNESYKEPLLRLFATSDFPVRAGISVEVATMHFLNTLAPYIKADKNRNSLTIQQVVDLFIHGVSSE